MKKLFLICLLMTLMQTGSFCKSTENIRNISTINFRMTGLDSQGSQKTIDSSLIHSFFESYPLLLKYKPRLVEIYRKYAFNHLWLDGKGVSEYGNSLYRKVKNIEIEGVTTLFPYQDKIAGVFEDEIENTLSDTETDLMLTTLFAYYTDKVYKGIDEKTTTSIGWFIPRKQLNFNTLLDSLLLVSNLPDQSEHLILRQYYKLRDLLQRYRDIEKYGGWNPIAIDPKLKKYKPGDSARAILQTRERLFAEGYLAEDNLSNKFDESLVAAVKKYQLHKGKKPAPEITVALLKSLNVPVSSRIKTIMVNMERCRWISPEVIKDREFIFVNIPSFWLTFYRDGKIELKSPVVVGKTMNKTVIFSGNMSYIVFSPYWNLPQSIINKEVKPGIAKNPNYLEKHNMEWNNGQVRQKPGKSNSLGLVKFIFPNSNDIYLHDTPSKSLFERESRAFSHGCIRVGRPRDLAVSILKENPDWTPAKIDAAMHAGIESTCRLKSKIPVYIGYFTAWVDDLDEINFFEDVYGLDERLAQLIIN